ncbi:hypothetical protein [Sphingobium sp. CFD-1]|nr:hypothetical protein [Sphingobium sp. CFD-1]
MKFVWIGQKLAGLPTAETAVTGHAPALIDNILSAGYSRLAADA